MSTQYHQLPATYEPVPKVAVEHTQGQPSQDEPRSRQEARRLVPATKALEPLYARFRRTIVHAAASLALAVALTTVAARADRAPMPAQEQARAALEEGKQALARNAPLAAVQAFQKALDLHPLPAAWLNLGTTLIRLGQPQPAKHALQAFVQHADPVADLTTIRAVEAELKRLQAASTELVLAVEPPPTQIWVDNQPVVPDDSVLWVTPGQHQLALQAPSHQLHQQSIDLPAGQFRFAVTLRPETAAGNGSDRAPNAMPRLDPTSSRPSVPTDPTLKSADPAPAPLPQPSALTGHTCWGAPICIGLQASFGAPNALGAGVRLDFGHRLTLRADGQFLPWTNIDGVDIRTELWSIGLRWHPFPAGWFAGLGLGVQRFKAHISRPTAIVDATLNIPCVGFELGYSTQGPGWNLGAGLQLLLPLRNDDLRLDSPPDDPELAPLQAELEQEANDAIDTFRDLLPVLFQLNLIQVSYTF